MRRIYNDKIKTEIMERFAKFSSGDHIAQRDIPDLILEIYVLFLNWVERAEMGSLK